MFNGNNCEKHTISKELNSLCSISTVTQLYTNAFFSHMSICEEKQNSENIESSPFIVGYLFTIFEGVKMLINCLLLTVVYCQCLGAA